MPKLIISGVTHELVDEAITIGRGPDNTIVVSDPSISTHHAQLLLEGDTYRLKDLDSTNGTRVNGKPVTEAVLRLMIGFALAQPKRDMSRRKSAVQNRCRSLRRSRLISRSWRRVAAFEQCISPSPPGTAERPGAHWNSYRLGNCAALLSREYHCGANDARAEHFEAAPQSR
jgi:hypothetical protein